MIAPALTTTWRAAGPSRAAAPRLTCKMASSAGERRQTYRLVYKTYLGKGLIEPNRYGMRVTPWHLLPTTSTFVALEGTRVMGTVTLIGDGELGLPMESVYPGEIEAARCRGLRLAEISGLAVKDVSAREFVPVLFSLTRPMFQFARFHGLDLLMIACHPRHAGFYRRIYGFENIGPERSYPSVRNKPAVACAVDVPDMEVTRPPCYEAMFGVPLPPDELIPQPMREQEADQFRSITAVASQWVPELA